MPACPCSSSDPSRHATNESGSLVAGHRFSPEVILLAVPDYLQSGAAAVRIASMHAAFPLALHRISVGTFEPWAHRDNKL